jgi:hypothetical protein
MLFAGILREKNKYRRRFLSKTENLWVRKNFLQMGKTPKSSFKKEKNLLLQNLLYAKENKKSISLGKWYIFQNS